MVASGRLGELAETQCGRRLGAALAGWLACWRARLGASLMAAISRRAAAEGERLGAATLRAPFSLTRRLVVAEGRDTETLGHCERVAGERAWVRVCRVTYACGRGLWPLWPMMSSEGESWPPLWLAAGPPPVLSAARLLVRWLPAQSWPTAQLSARSAGHSSTTNAPHTAAGAHCARPAAQFKVSTRAAPPPRVRPPRPARPGWFARAAGRAARAVCVGGATRATQRHS